MKIMDGVYLRLREQQLRTEALDVAIKFNALASEAHEAGDRVGALRAMTMASAIHLAVNFGEKDALAEDANQTESVGAKKPCQEGDRADL